MGSKISLRVMPTIHAYAQGVLFGSLPRVARFVTAFAIPIFPLDFLKKLVDTLSERVRDGRLSRAWVARNA